MFLESSRYSGLETVAVALPGGGSALAVKLRRLPFPGGVPVEVQGQDRLDVMALRRYKDATRFWHIADANTEPEASALLRPKGAVNPLAAPPVRRIRVPEK